MPDGPVVGSAPKLTQRADEAPLPDAPRLDTFVEPRQYGDGTDITAQGTADKVLHSYSATATNTVTALCMGL